MDGTQKSLPQLHPSTSNNKTRKKRKRFGTRGKNDDSRNNDNQEKNIATDGGTEKEIRRKTPTVGNFPFPVDYNDHFETPARAYGDIYPLLNYILVKKLKLNQSLKRQLQQQQQQQQQCMLGDGGSPNIVSQPNNEPAITIYDPYYCAGRAAIHLRDEFRRNDKNKTNRLPVHIQHEKRDFYRDIRQNTVPPFDILVTNPPYSESHKERCLQFAVNQLKEHRRPFFLLMPNYIATKEYYRKIILGDQDVQTFYIIPSSEHPYEYDHPDGTGHSVSPFASVWFCGLSCNSNDGNNTAKNDIVGAFVSYHSARAPSPNGTPRIVTTLQELIQIGAVSGARRKNPRQRKKMRVQAMKRDNAGRILDNSQQLIGKK